MPPIHFDGLRDYIVSRPPTGAPWRYYAGNRHVSTKGCPVFKQGGSSLGDTIHWVEKCNIKYDWYLCTVEPSGLTVEITISQQKFDTIKDTVDYHLLEYNSNSSIYSPYYAPQLVVWSDYAGGAFWHIYVSGNVIAKRYGVIFPCPLELGENPLIASGTSSDNNPLSYVMGGLSIKKKCNLDNDYLGTNPLNKKIFDSRAEVIDPPNRTYGQYAISSSSPDIAHGYQYCSIVNQSTFVGRKHMNIITDKRCAAPTTSAERVAFYAITGIDYRLRTGFTPNSGIVNKDDVVRLFGYYDGVRIRGGIYQSLVDGASTANLSSFKNVSEAVFQIMSGNLASYVDWEHFSYDDADWGTKYGKPIYGIDHACVGWPSSSETLLLTNLDPSGGWYHTHTYDPSALNDYPWFINRNKVIYTRQDRI